MLNKFSKIIIFIYAITAIFWFLFIFSTQYSGTLEGWKFEYLLKPFLIGMTVLPLVGGIIGLLNSKHWGGYKSIFGKSIMGLSLGMIAWGGGMIIWNYYLFFTTVTVPYPSLADAVFILSWPLWTYGILKLSKVIGAHFAARQKSGKSFIIFIPIIIIAISVYLLVYVARGGIVFDQDFLKLFFDLFYPLGDIVILSVTVLVYLLSKNYLGGMYKVPVLLLMIGFLMNYFSDFLFSYVTTKGTYFNGHLADFLFTTTMFILALSLSMFNPKVLEQNKKV